MRVNYALAANGGVASASSTGGIVAKVNNGDRRGLNWDSQAGWQDATADAYPDWVRIDFPAPCRISEIDVFTVQDAYTAPAEPTLDQTFTLYGIVGFLIQRWAGSAWVTVPAG